MSRSIFKLLQAYRYPGIAALLLALIIVYIYQGTNNAVRPIRAEEFGERLATILKGHCPGEILDQKCLDGITVLNLSGQELDTLRGLERCPNLERLDLSAQYLSDRTCLYHLRDLNALSLLNELNWLNVSCNQLPRADFLRGANSLKYLDAAANRFYDFTPFTQLESLETLDLHNNKIMRIQGFGTTTRLRELDLYGNPLVELSGLESLLQLEHLDIGGTDLTADRIRQITDELQERGVSVDS